MSNGSRSTTLSLPCDNWGVMMPKPIKTSRMTTQPLNTQYRSCHSDKKSKTGLLDTLCLLKHTHFIEIEQVKKWPVCPLLPFVVCFMKISWQAISKHSLWYARNQIWLTGNFQIHSQRGGPRGYQQLHKFSLVDFLMQLRRLGNGYH